MAKDSDLEDLLLELQKDVARAMDGVVSNEIKEVYKEEVEYMYDEYEPSYYKRRYVNKGFSDETNWDIDVKFKGSGIRLTLVNNSKAVKSRIRLDKIIEEGTYDWNVIISERPVYERTQDRIEMEEVVDNILEGALKKQGWDFK